MAYSYDEYTAHEKRPRESYRGRCALSAPATTRRAWASARATAATARAARSSLRLWPGLVHDQVAVPEETSIEHLYGLGGLFLGGHLDKPKSPRPARELVSDDAH